MPSSPDALSGLHCAPATSATSQLSEAHSGGGLQPHSLAVEHRAHRMRVQRRRGVESRADVLATALVPPCAAHVSQGWTHRVNDVCGPYAGSSSRDSSTVAPDGPSLVRGFPGALLVRRRVATLTVRRTCLSTPQPRCAGPGGHHRVVQAAVPRPRGGTQARQGTADTAEPSPSLRHKQRMLTA